MSINILLGISFGIGFLVGGLFMYLQISAYRKELGLRKEVLTKMEIKK